MRRLALLLALWALPAGAGDTAPVTLLDGDGREVAVRPAPGETLLLHFWATWCPSCAEDLAHLADAAEGCGDALRVLAVAVGDDPDEIDAFVARHAVRLPVLRDPRGRAWKRFGGRGLPVNVFWSETGHTHDTGPRSREQWQARLVAFGCGSTP